MADEMSKLQQKTLLRNVLITFLISGASSSPLGSFIPFLRAHYNFEYRISGMLLSAQSLGNLLAVILAGFLPSYLGRRTSILVTAIWMALGYSFITTGLGSAPLLIFICLMLGVAKGGNSNFSNTMISTLPQEEATKGYNLLHGAFAIGALSSPLLLIGLNKLSPGIGWQLMTALIAVIAAVQVIIYLRMPLPQEPPRRGLRSINYSFLKVRAFWYSSAMLFFYVSAEYAMGGWLVTYFQDNGYLDANLSQAMNSLLWLVIFAGRMVGAFIGNRVSKYKILLIDGFGFFIFFLIMFSGKTTLPIIIGLMGAGFFMATVYPTATAVGSAAIRGNDMGTSLLVFAGSAGGIITPAIIGFIASFAGIKAGMGLLVIITALLLLSIVVSYLDSRHQERIHSMKPGQ